MIIAQLSDPHVTIEGSRFNDLYDTATRLEIAVDTVNRMHPKPDLAFLTGDLVNYGGDEEYDVLKPILEKLKMPYYLGIGNHDSRETFLEKFSDQDYLPKDGFVQYVIKQDGLRMIMLDTNIPEMPQGTLCTRRLDWLDGTLSAEPDTPTMIFMHHPPFKTGIVAMDKMGFLKEQEFGKIIDKHKQILRICCGHIHRSIHTNFHGVSTHVCPSTSHKVLLNLEPAGRLATTAEPSELLLHIWDGKGSIVTHTSFTDDYPIMWELGK